MKRNKVKLGRMLSTLALALCAVGSMPSATTNVPDAAEIVSAAEPGRAVDLALCLDTSGSMDGLIDAARQNLWTIVNLLGDAEPTPRLRVALLTFGNDSYGRESGWVKVDSELTADLDRISEQLFALSTNGGTEYVGRVMRTALDQLDWGPGADTLKLIVVAGNESADQDPVFATRDVASEAIRNGIMVNTIYCGPPNGEAAGWQSVARLADGHFSSIDHNNGTVIVSSPFDDELASLSASVNETYIPFGDAGRQGFSNQRAQDANAAKMSSAAVASRAGTKAGKLYVNQWDLVDALEGEAVSWESIDPKQLPEEMQGMELAEQKAYVAQKHQQRGEIQAKIRALQVQRQNYIAEEKQRHAIDDSSSLERALGEAIRSQATSKGFQFGGSGSADAVPDELP